jgi:hypothetical protein
MRLLLVVLAIIASGCASTMHPTDPGLVQERTAIHTNPASECAAFVFESAGKEGVTSHHRWHSVACARFLGDTAERLEYTTSQPFSSFYGNGTIVARRRCVDGGDARECIRYIWFGGEWTGGIAAATGIRHRFIGAVVEEERCTRGGACSLSARTKRGIEEGLVYLRIINDQIADPAHPEHWAHIQSSF